MQKMKFLKNRIFKMATWVKKTKTAKWAFFCQLERFRCFARARVYNNDVIYIIYLYIICKNPPHIAILLYNRKNSCITLIFKRVTNFSKIATPCQNAFFPPHVAILRFFPTPYRNFTIFRGYFRTFFLLIIAQNGFQELSGVTA